MIIEPPPIRLAITNDPIGGFDSSFCSTAFQGESMDYTDSEQGQYDLLEAEHAANEQRQMEDLIKEYRDVRERMLSATVAAFPAGARVQPKGTTSGNWGATVRDIDKHHRKNLSPDMVFLDWDNGNKFAVCIDEIERVR